jgi:hypothetical protein
LFFSVLPFHDWHLEIFKSPSDHAPHVGDPTPIICEVTPRTEQRVLATLLDSLPNSERTHLGLVAEANIC